MFISVEGIEGVGKSTHLKFIAQELEKAGIAVVQTREPGGTTIGEEIRTILLSHRREPVAPLTELLLMFAARAQHMESVVHPALKEGRWVLCDRFIDSTYAYQGGGRGISENAIAVLEKLVLNAFSPDVTFIFDAPAEVGLKRVQGRQIDLSKVGESQAVDRQAAQLDRFEQEEMAFFERVRQTYHSHAIRNPSRYRVIDATRSLEEVQGAIMAVIMEIIKTKIQRK